MTTFGSDDESMRRASPRGGDSERRAGRFPDARSAGRDLASKMEPWAGREDVLVLAVARGGVPVASEFARRLRLPLDLLLIRRLLVTRGPDAPVCAMNVGGNLFLDEELTSRPRAPASALDIFVAEALDELARRERFCRNARPPVALARKTVLLVDNGIRTGSTVRACIRGVRAYSPARIVVVAPVVAMESRDGVETAADELVCLAFPEPFGHVGLWYAKFDRPDDEEIREMLEP